MIVPFTRNRIVVLCSALLFLSCEFNLDTDFKGIKASPNMVLPLAYGDLSIQDFLGDEDSATVKVYASGPDANVFYLYYEQTLKTQEIGELLVIDDRTVTRNLNINPTAIPITLPASNQNQSLSSGAGTLPFDLGLSPEKLEEVFFREGDLRITVTTSPAIPNLQFEGTITLPTFKKNNVALQQVVQTGAATQTTSIANYLATFDANVFDVNVAVVVKPHTSPAAIPAGTRFNVSLQFAGLEFEYITGFFGEQTADLPDETLEIGAFENSFDDGDFSLADPRVSFEVVNEYGIPVSVFFNQLQARNSTGSLNLTLNPASPIISDFPEIRGDSAFTNVSVTNANQLLDFKPTEFYYNVSAVINDGLTSGLNFCERESELKVRMKVEIPFIGHASNIVISDTVDIDISDVDASDIESAILRINADNRLPLDATLQLYLLNENNFLLDSLLAPNTLVVEGAQTDSNGNTTASTILKKDIEISNQKINKLFEAKKIIIASRLNTSDAQNQKDVKFKSTDKLNIKLGLNANLKLNLDL